MAQVKLSVDLESGNAAFDPAEGEIARILAELSESIRKGRAGKFTLRDHNGNAVGSAFLEISETEG